MSSNERIAELGLGYVGRVSAACLAKLGHQVVGVDLDEFKVSSIQQSKSPFFEPGLEELLTEVVASGSLTATIDLAKALADSDIALICVGTPSAQNGNQSSEQIERFSQAIATTLEGRDRELLVVIRSTVFPGTCESLAVGSRDEVTVLSHPEFLREGSAIKDFMEPSLIVVGALNQAANALAISTRSSTASPALSSFVRPR